MGIYAAINPDSMLKTDVDYKPPVVKKPKAKVAKAVLSEEEKIKIGDDKYKALITQENDGKVIVEIYRGSTEKADYRCTLCGHTWSTRPDHFKNRQRYKCPICSKDELSGK